MNQTDLTSKPLSFNATQSNAMQCQLSWQCWCRCTVCTVKDNPAACHMFPRLWVDRYSVVCCRFMLNVFTVGSFSAVISLTSTLTFWIVIAINITLNDPLYAVWVSDYALIHDHCYVDIFTVGDLSAPVEAVVAAAAAAKNGTAIAGSAYQQGYLTSAAQVTILCHMTI